MNLYPFEREREIEMIDVGGPAMLRAAAKNHAHVTAVCRPDQYESVLEELRGGGVSEQTRRRLAAAAFGLTAGYDAAITSWLAGQTFPDRLTLAFDKAFDLAYGENPHQRAAFYTERGSMPEPEQLHGKPLSFNNLHDLAAARLLLLEWTCPRA